MRKEPRQERSRAMVDAILQAAAEVFAEHGYARATTNRIAERAGVSVGSLYQYFPHKDSLLASLLETHHADVRRVVFGAMAQLADPDTPLERGLRGLLDGLVEVHRENPALTRALSASVLRESPAAERAHKPGDDTDDLAVVQLLAARPDVREGDHRAMAAVLRQALTQLTRWMVHEAPEDLDTDSVREEVLALLLRYLEKR